MKRPKVTIYTKLSSDGRRNKYGTGYRETEKQLLEKVRKVALLTGWKFYHTWNSFRSAKGFPDCVLVKKGRIMFLELKTEKGKLSQEQKDWLYELSIVTSVDAYLIRPLDFGSLVEQLKR